MPTRIRAVALRMPTLCLLASGKTTLGRGEEPEEEKAEKREQSRDELPEEQWIALHERRDGAMREGDVAIP